MTKRKTTVDEIDLKKNKQKSSKLQETLQQNSGHIGHSGWYCSDAMLRFWVLGREKEKENRD